jgi:HK97 family phage portal protein
MSILRGIVGLFSEKAALNLPSNAVIYDPSMVNAGTLEDVSTGRTIPAWQNKRPQWNQWNTEKAITNGFKVSSWVYACVQRVMAAAASAPLVVKVPNAKGVLEAAPDHPLQILLDNPNPHMSRSDLMQRIAATLLLGGNHVLSEVRAGLDTNKKGKRYPKEIWPIDIAGLQPILDKEKFISGYYYNRDGVSFVIDIEDAVHMMLPDPGNPWWGMSPLQAAARTVDTDIEAVNFNKVALQNRAMADGAFISKQPLNAKQFEEIRRQMRENHQGSSNARQPWIVGAEFEWVQFTMTPAEMDFIKSREFTREEICSVFGVPPPLVGIYDKATLNNIKEARRIFWVDTIIPFLESVTGALTRGLGREYEDSPKVCYDLNKIDVFVEDFFRRIDAGYKLYDMGVPFRTVNERLDLGVEEFVGDDVSFVATTRTPAGALSENANGDAVVPDDDEDEEDDKKPPKKKPKKPARETGY